MPYPVYFRRVRLRLGALALVGLAVACAGSDQLSPSTDGVPAAGDSLAAPVDSTAVPTDSTAVPTDSTVIPVDSTLIANALTGGSAPGIVFGTFDLSLTLLGSLHTGSLRLPTPYTLPTDLATARSRGPRTGTPSSPA